MRRMTTLGLNERVERVLAYSLFWVSGFVLLLVEKNENVRWHAKQSLITFGTLSLLMFGVTMLNTTLSWIPLLGVLTSFGLGLLLRILIWTWFILWIWLMIMAWVRPDYRLPFVSKWVRNIL
ncbi:hypothetical protein KDA_13160 [Dictyobacter alpinus]|uniref:DUF4870 domain-containing protein n=2 Tax=Dictyobacter alpinus TaxID=2014873 RepID=A0A402B3A3_9CHLR|nr:hypothetical protein KDA_13160 [Dictyobacter alpinus]